MGTPPGVAASAPKASTASRSAAPWAKATTAQPPTAAFRTWMSAPAANMGAARSTAAPTWAASSSKQRSSSASEIGVFSSALRPQLAKISHGDSSLVLGSTCACNLTVTPPCTTISWVRRKIASLMTACSSVTVAHPPPGDLRTEARSPLATPPLLEDVADGFATAFAFLRREPSAGASCSSPSASGAPFFLPPCTRRTSTLPSFL
mmetsp:Transcript_2093/g.5871  ORF Transcript_2093/g.5871 Transcript_2093/m.5871 type:complete len:206 (-) Transcript_2093:83-700(-)